MPVIPFWLKIVGPLVLLMLVVGGAMAWGKSKFNAGKEEGVAETHATYKAASDKLRADAAKTATRADDAAAVRVEENFKQATEEAAAVEKAKEEGSSPLDVLFGELSLTSVARKTHISSTVRGLTVCGRSAYAMKCVEQPNDATCKRCRIYLHD